MESAVCLGDLRVRFRTVHGIVQGTQLEVSRHALHASGGPFDLDLHAVDIAEVPAADTPEEVTLEDDILEDIVQSPTVASVRRRRETDVETGLQIVDYLAIGVC